MTWTGWDETDEMLLAIANATRVATVPIPPHPDPDVDVVAYCPASAEYQYPSCRVEGLSAPIMGPLVIVGLDGDRHRPLTREEMQPYYLERSGEPGGLPTLRVTSSGND